MTMTSSRKEDLRWSITTLTEAIEYCQAEGTDYTRQAEVLAQYKAELADLESRGIDLPGIPTNPTEGTGTPRKLTDRPQAGAAASNQYGTFSVHYASAAQTKFIKGLMEQKDLSKLADSVIIDVARLREQVATQQVNKKAASAIIDRLLALPDVARTAAPTFTGTPATDKQYAFITSLLGDKALDAEDRAKVVAAVEGKTLSAKGASATIDKLLALPKAVAPATDVEAGVYTNGTTTYRVYLGQNSGQMLAAKVVEHDGQAEFVYAGKAARFVTGAFRKLTIEEAAKFGKATGTCIVCARRLDVPESVDRGIGPVCFAKMGG